MIAATAVVTEKGGSTSHAAVVTRALGRPSVVGVGDGVAVALAGTELTVDGTSGVVYSGRLATEEVHTSEVPGLDELLDWARRASPVQVVDAAPNVLELDAQGVGFDAEGAPDVERLAERLRTAPAAAGSVLATDAGARALLVAGVKTVVRQAGQPEPVLLLRIVQAMSQIEKEENSP